MTRHKKKNGPQAWTFKYNTNLHRGEKENRAEWRTRTTEEKTFTKNTGSEIGSEKKTKRYANTEHSLYTDTWLCWGCHHGDSNIEEKGPAVPGVVHAVAFRI